MTMNEEEIGRLGQPAGDAGPPTTPARPTNAGRAVGSLARRLGLSGGQLKAIFMAGMESGGEQTVRIAALAARVATLEADLEAARESLHRAEVAARSLQRERDALRTESEQLHDALDRRRTSRRVRFVAVVLLLAVHRGRRLARRATVRACIWHPGKPRRSRRAAVPSYSKGDRPRSQCRPAAATPTSPRPRRDHAERRHPASSCGGRLSGAIWTQWVEIEVAGQTGYVLSDRGQSVLTGKQPAASSFRSTPLSRRACAFRADQPDQFSRRLRDPHSFAGRMLDRQLRSASLRRAAAPRSG